MHLRSQALAFERWDGRDFLLSKIQVPKMVRNLNRNVKLYGYGLCMLMGPHPQKSRK